MYIKRFIMDGLTFIDYCKQNNKEYLLVEWDKMKNGEIPLDLTFGSRKEYYWICPNGHSYTKKVCERTSKNQGCRYCANKALLRGYNDLQTRHSDLADEWDYEKNEKSPSEVLYCSNKVAYWICPKGHSYEKKIFARTYRGAGCLYCANKVVLKGFNDLQTRCSDLAKEWDYEKNEKSPSEVLYCTDKRAHWICSKCGYKWVAKVDERSKYGKTGCPRCAGLYGLTHMDACKLLEENNPNIELNSTFINLTTPVSFKCKKCGYEWSTRYSKKVLLGKTHCAGCQGIAHKSNAVFIKELKEVFPTIITLEPYSNNRTLIKCQCSICGNIWSAKPNNLLHGHGCKKCADKQSAIKRTISEKDFLNRVNEVNPFVNVLGKYEKASEKIKCECAICGHIWEPKAISLTQGRSCPRCCRSSTSFMEKFFYYTFVNVFAEEKIIANDRKILDGKELDIYVPSMNIAVEPGSWVFHRHQIESDTLKRETCNNLGIRLFLVYDKYDGDEKPFDKDCFCFSRDLAARCNFDVLKEIVTDIVISVGGSCDHITTRDWEDIRNKATFETRGGKEQEFLSIMDEMHPEIKILGRYRGSKEKISCKCRACGNEWAPIPNALISQRQGCPVCGKIKGINNRKKPVICIETGEIFESMTDAMKKGYTDKRKIKKCCQGELETYKGFHWKYIEQL